MCVVLFDYAFLHPWFRVCAGEHRDSGSDFGINEANLLKLVFACITGTEGERGRVCVAQGAAGSTIPSPSQAKALNLSRVSKSVPDSSGRMKY